MTVVTILWEEYNKNDKKVRTMRKETMIDFQIKEITLEHSIDDYSQTVTIKFRKKGMSQKDIEEGLQEMGVLEDH